MMGSGGVGGFFGGRLAHAGYDVTFIARGAHLAAMRERGLVIESAAHGDIRVPVSAVRGVWFTADPCSVLRGFRFPGTGGLGSIAVGTWRGSGVKDFVVLHGRGPAVVVELEGAEFARLLVTEDDAEPHAAWLRRAVGLA